MTTNRRIVRSVVRQVAQCAASLLLASTVSAQVRITEWQYNGEEFIEFTNVSPSPVDMTGWSFDDDSRVPGTVSLSAFGIVAPGASMILCERPVAAFIADWGLTGVAVIGANATNLGRADEINLFDASATLVDRLTFGDANLPGSIRTLNVSGSPCHGALGLNDVYAWSLAYVGDSRGSLSVNGNVGNPGRYTIVDAALVTYGTGCAGVAGIPSLTGRGCPARGGQALLAVANGAPNALAVLLFGTQRTAVSVGGCFLYVDPLLVQVVLNLTATGDLSVALQVPTSLAPTSLTTQVVIADLAASAGFTTTNGLELVIR